MKRILQKKKRRHNTASVVFFLILFREPIHESIRTPVNKAGVFKAIVLRNVCYWLIIGLKTLIRRNVYLFFQAIISNRILIFITNNE